MKKVVISVDYETNSEEFWDAFYEKVEAHSAPPAARKLRDGDLITLDAFTARAFAAWCADLPGWNTGCEYAPNPLVFREVAS
jgi:hypothetical protein